MKPAPFQFTIGDLLLLTTLTAGIVAAVVVRDPNPAFITASCMLAFIWRRPIVHRIWAVGMIGLGAGIFAAGCAGNYTLHLPSGEMIGWGAGMVFGTIASLVIFFPLQTPVLRSEQAEPSEPK